MITGKKVLNIFGIIIAWILSICLVLLLFAAPVTLSALSFGNPQQLRKTIVNLDLAQVLSTVEVDVPDEQSQQMLDLLSTNAVQELYELCVDYTLGTLNPSLPQVALTEEAVQDIVHRNIDELYQLAVAHTPELANLSEAEAKAQLEPNITEFFLSITTSLPAPEEMRQSLTDNDMVDMALNILFRTNTIKACFIGAIAVLALLIFLCRLPGWRGFRWLATDLFIAGGFSGIVCAALNLVGDVFKTLLGDDATGLLVTNTFLPAFTKGVYIRTGIMIVSAIALLAIYLYIKKSSAKKVVSLLSETTTEPGLAE